MLQAVIPIKRPHLCTSSGHNLGLRHAGTTDLPNCKPNYLSVMNYAFQFPTFLTGGNWPMDYSHNVLNSLKESALNESAGIGLAQPSNLKTVVDIGRRVLMLSHTIIILVRHLPRINRQLITIGGRIRTLTKSCHLQ